MQENSLRVHVPLSMQTAGHLLQEFSARRFSAPVVAVVYDRAALIPTDSIRTTGQRIRTVRAKAGERQFA